MTFFETIPSLEPDDIHQALAFAAALFRDAGDECTVSGASDPSAHARPAWAGDCSIDSQCLATIKARTITCHRLPIGRSD
jgi:hypothetical protein